MIKAIIKVNGDNYIGQSDTESVKNVGFGGFGWGESKISVPEFSNSKPAKILECQMNIESALKKIFKYFVSIKQDFKKIEVINYDEINGN